MGRANVEAELHRLDAVSRSRALTDGESRLLEVMVKSQHAYDRLAKNNRNSDSYRPAHRKRAGRPKSDTPAADTAGVGAPTRSNVCAPGSTISSGA